MSTVTETAAGSMWTTKANNSDGGDFERPGRGMYPAVLIGLVDLGTHTHVFQGESKKARKLFLAWELSGENDSKGEAFVVGQDYTWSLHKKAKFRALVEGWNGAAMNDAEEFDVSTLLGKTCCVTITEGQTAGGKKFSEIASVGPVMKSMVVPPATRALFGLHISQFNSSVDKVEIPDWMPRIYGRLIADEIKASEEYGNLPPY